MFVEVLTPCEVWLRTVEDGKVSLHPGQQLDLSEADATDLIALGHVRAFVTDTGRVSAPVETRVAAPVSRPATAKRRR